MKYIDQLLELTMKYLERHTLEATTVLNYLIILIVIGILYNTCMYQNITFSMFII